MPWRAARGVGERCPSNSEQDTRTGEEAGRMPGKDWGSAMGEPLTESGGKISGEGKWWTYRAWLRLLCSKWQECFFFRLGVEAGRYQTLRFTVGWDNGDVNSDPHERITEALTRIVWAPWKPPGFWGDPEEEGDPSNAWNWNSCKSRKVRTQNGN